MAATPYSIDPANSARSTPIAQSGSTLLKPDGSPDDNDRVEIGPTNLAFDEWAALGLEIPNLETHARIPPCSAWSQQIAEKRLRRSRCCSTRSTFATPPTPPTCSCGSRTTRRAPAFVGADGHIALFDFHSCEHLSAHLPLVKEHRHGASFFYFESGYRGEEHAGIFAGGNR